MPRGNIMLQVEVTQTLDTVTTDAPIINVQVSDFLTGGKTVVREIAVEKIGGIAANQVGALAFDYGNKGYAKVSLLSTEPDQPHRSFVLFAPSHVPSPPIEGAQEVILQLIDIGFHVDPPVTLVGARRLGGHVYLEETS
jgi:hypothetical protein